jgi:outer membrane protein OmpA-like peptidoglycan-associated protein
MKKALPINVLLVFLVWQLIAASYTFGQATASSGSTTPTATPTVLSLSIFILYFDQSSATLRPGVKSTLDSIAQQLVAQPAWMATVTGYTDDVGKRELNLALAEHRAKAVQTYLKQRGVPTDQVMAKWEGPAKKTADEVPETVKTISRRVVVQLSPK